MATILIRKLNSSSCTKFKEKKLREVCVGSDRFRKVEVFALTVTCGFSFLGTEAIRNRILSHIMSSAKKGDLIALFCIHLSRMFITFVRHIKTVVTSYIVMLMRQIF